MPVLLHNLERGALAVTRSRAGEKSANRLNGLAVSSDDAADIALSELNSKDRHAAVWNLREHHFVRIIDELANDELEELFHGDSGVDVDSGAGAEGGSTAGGGSGIGASAVGAGDAAGSAAAGAGAAAASVATGAGAAFGAAAAFFAATAAAFFAAASGSLFFLIKLRTVSDSCAPRAIQYSARSSFNVLL